MTKLLRIAVYSAAIIACLIIVGCACWPWQKNCKYASIHVAGDSFSQVGLALQPYGLSLYRIEKYKNGKKIAEKGTLTDLAPGVVKVRTDAKTDKFTGTAIQAGRYHFSGSSTTQVAIGSLTDLSKLTDILKDSERK
jgi:hypothetical protein